MATDKPKSLLTNSDISMNGHRIIDTAPGIAPTDVAIVAQLGGGGGGGTPHVEYRTITSPEATAKQLTLAFSPTVSAYTLLDTIGGTAQQYSVDYTVTGAILSWSGLALDPLLSAGDVLRIVYWT